MSRTNDEKITNFYNYCGVCGGYMEGYQPITNPGTAQPMPCTCPKQIPINPGFLGTGWKCPNCGAGLSPTTSQCPNCKPPFTVTCNATK